MMHKIQVVGLLTAGLAHKSSLARLPVLLARLGPIKAPTFRLASRIANALRAGHPVRAFEELGSCQLLILHANGGALPALADEVAAKAAQLDRPLVLLIDSPCESCRLASLHEAGLKVAALNAVPGSEQKLFLLDGEAELARRVRKFVELSGGRAVPSAAWSAQFIEAGTSVAAGLLVPLLEAGHQCLRASGLPPSQCSVILERVFHASLRSFLKAGRKAWKGPVQRMDREALLAQLASLGRADPALARYLSEITAASLRYFHPGQEPGEALGPGPVP